MEELVFAHLGLEDKITLQFITEQIYTTCFISKIELLYDRDNPESLLLWYAEGATVAGGLYLQAWATSWPVGLTYTPNSGKVFAYTDHMVKEVRDIIAGLKKNGCIIDTFEWRQNDV